MRCSTSGVLEATRTHAPGAVFIFTSTNKVYGDLPNSLPLEELETRWEIDPGQPQLNGSAMPRFRHYRTLDLTEARLRRLLAEFRFGTISEVLVNQPVQEVDVPLAS